VLGELNEQRDEFKDRLKVGGLRVQGRFRERKAAHSAFFH
jgi:hypothetical protein